MKEKKRKRRKEYERERTSEGLENRRGSIIGLDRAIQEVDEERHASDEVAKTSRRESARTSSGRKLNQP